MPVVKKQTVKKKSRTKKSLPSKGDSYLTGSILSRAEPAQFNKGLKINLYGASGTGKTTLWGTFPKPILCLLKSGGDKPGELLSLDKKTLSQVKVISPQTTYEIQEVAMALVGDETYPTVVVDHLLGMQDMSMCEVGGFDEAPEQKSWGILDQGEWGKVGSQVKEALKPLLSLPLHIVLIAQEKVFHADSKDPYIIPFAASALIPTLVTWLDQSVDYTCRTFIQSTPNEDDEDEGIEDVLADMEYCLRVSPHFRFRSKFRKPKGVKRPEYIVDPTYDKIVQLINE